MITQVTSDGDGYGVWRRPRSESSADAESVYMTNAVLSDSGYAHHSRRSSVSDQADFIVLLKLIEMNVHRLQLVHQTLRKIVMLALKIGV